MKLIVTGGGTGGHVYPALEVAKLALRNGHEVVYLGSLRGQEGGLSQKSGIEFRGFASEPITSLRTRQGLMALVKFLKAKVAAREDLSRRKPTAVFSTGGYSSAPVVSACRSLGIPYVLHEQNSVPGRSNLLFAKKAFCVATTFRSTSGYFKQCRTERTGLPIRTELREACRHGAPERPRILVTGGSQGAAALNQAALETASRTSSEGWCWLHLTGKAHFDSVLHSHAAFALGKSYEVKDYIEGAELAEIFASSSLAVCRSGAGTLAELAAFRLPSVLIPYPLAFAGHQLQNAAEFEEIGAAVVVNQDDLHSARLESAIKSWLGDCEAVARARSSLEEWDAPNAANRILHLLQAATQANQ